jgi:hypothetical protein
MFDSETLLRNCTSVTPGVFILQKVKFLNVQNVNNPRCDNLTYSGVNVVEGTEYANEALSIHVKSAFTNTKIEPQHVVRYERVIDASPHFMIIYVEMTYTVQGDLTPGVSWWGRSFFHLLKNIREWSLVNSEGIDTNHPMGIYSNIALTEFDPPQEILNEIDGWPDMHLAKFLKGNQDYKAIPEDFPDPSEQMKQWVLSLADEYKEKTFSEILDII